VLISISSQDLDRLALISPSLCTTSTNCYLLVQAGAITDDSPLKNSVVPITARLALSPSKFTKDNTFPTLLSFNINMEIGSASFTLDKIMNCTATQVTNIVFQYSVFAGTSPLVYRMTNSFIPVCGQLSKTVTISFGYDDIQILKSYNTLLKSVETSYVRLDSPAFYDTFGNANLVLYDGLALQVTNFVRNSDPPQMLSFTVNNQQQMNIFFSQPIDATSLVISNIFFQDRAVSPTFTFHLNQAKLYFISLDHKEIKVQLLGDYSKITASSSKNNSNGTKYSFYLKIDCFHYLLDIFKYQFTTFLGASR
jgi:hypothetical protein